MPDVFDSATRGRMMSAIRARDTKPELAVRRRLHSAGLRYRLHVRSLPGRPDIVLPGRKAVVFVQGCFWHQHEGCPDAHFPKSRTDYWIPKLNGNRVRDGRRQAELRALGWAVEVIWECETNDDTLEALADRLKTISPRRVRAKVWSTAISRRP